MAIMDAAIVVVTVSGSCMATVLPSTTCSVDASEIILVAVKIASETLVEELVEEVESRDELL